jgi:hypothetical protein
MPIIRLPYSFRPDVGSFSHLREIAVMQTRPMASLESGALFRADWVRRCSPPASQLDSDSDHTGPDTQGDGASLNG